MEQYALYPAERQGTQGQIRQVDHPPPHTPTLTSPEPCFTSDVKAILINDHCVLEVGVVPKGKDQLEVGPWMLCTCTYQDREEGKGESF